MADVSAFNAHVMAHDGLIYRPQLGPRTVKRRLIFYRNATSDNKGFCVLAIDLSHSLCCLFTWISAKFGCRKILLSAPVVHPGMLQRKGEDCYFYFLVSDQDPPKCADAVTTESYGCGDCRNIRMRWLPKHTVAVTTESYGCGDCQNIRLRWLMEYTDAVTTDLNSDSSVAWISLFNVGSHWWKSRQTKVVTFT